MPQVASSVSSGAGSRASWPAPASAVVTRAFDIHAAVADHPALCGLHLQPAQRLADQLRRVAARAVQGRTDDLLEQPAERQVGKDAARMRFVLGGDHRQAVATTMQRAQGVFHLR
ncbi:hypothetical protein G6F63_014898 [Rhizopus arrhizus]|nr:hypothetical protein G6F63_014898 [Rhizopus arrhizus]